MGPLSSMFVVAGVVWRCGGQVLTSGKSRHEMIQIQQQRPGRRESKTHLQQFGQLWAQFERRI